VVARSGSDEFIKVCLGGILECDTAGSEKVAKLDRGPHPYASRIRSCLSQSSATSMALEPAHDVPPGEAADRVNITGRDSWNNLVLTPRGETVDMRFPRLEDLNRDKQVAQIVIRLRRGSLSKGFRADRDFTAGHAFKEFGAQRSMG